MRGQKIRSAACFFCLPKTIQLSNWLHTVTQNTGIISNGAGYRLDDNWSLISRAWGLDTCWFQQISSYIGKS